MTYDNLNRMTATPKVIPIGSKTSWAYTNDILGNRTGRNSNQSDASSALYSWDVLNRMLMQATPSAGGSYRYRADGQRIEKVEGPTLDWVAPPPLSTQSGHYDLNYGDSNPTSRYFYDGQMGIEDDYNPSGTVTVVNRYALGARGIDRVEKYADSTTTYGYPLYDGHGNMRTTLARSGSSYSTGTFKTYDVWGSVRSGGDSGDPAQKYCANLGHVNDPESGLIYMRARYHEPATGRFVSEDPAGEGGNWYVYCLNNPIQYFDESGRDAESIIGGAILAMLMGPHLMMYFVTLLVVHLARFTYKYLLPIGFLVAGNAFLNSIEPQANWLVGLSSALGTVLTPTNWQGKMGDLLAKLRLGGSREYLGRLGGGYAGMIAYGVVLLIVYLATSLWTAEDER